METLGQRVDILKDTIARHDGENVADLTFRSEVETLISAFYDDIGRITTVPIRSVFDLFLIKTLYVKRQSRDAAVLEYLGDMLTRHLATRELFKFAPNRRQQIEHLIALADELKQPQHYQNLFEACRLVADNALFITGVFPRSVRRGRARRMARTGLAEKALYVTWGKTYYQRAAEQDLAEATHLREPLLKLSRFFEVYMEALNEASETYIMGLDMNIVANKMLDAFNRYRETGDELYIENARKYAALLKVDSDKFPALFEKIALLPQPRG